MKNMLDEDVRTNRSIGSYGAADILRRSTNESKVNILTHCNTGSLATAGYGTALGVVRSLFEMGELEHCYCTETRPYNQGIHFKSANRQLCKQVIRLVYLFQGSRLTAYELVYEKIPATLVCDNMVGLLLASRSISAIVVGADRVVLNGDTANKIGTYQIAILAKHHNVPFYVAVPTTSIDFEKRTGKEIEIENRSPREMTHIKDIQIAAQGKMSSCLKIEKQSIRK